MNVPSVYDIEMLTTLGQAQVGVGSLFLMWCEKELNKENDLSVRTGLCETISGFSSDKD